MEQKPYIDKEADLSHFLDKRKSESPTIQPVIIPSKSYRKVYIYSAIILVLIIIQLLVIYFTRPPKPIAKTVAPPKTQTK